MTTQEAIELLKERVVDNRSWPEEVEAVRLLIAAAREGMEDGKRLQSYPFMNCPNCGEFRGHSHVCHAIRKEKA